MIDYWMSAWLLNHKLLFQRLQNDDGVFSLTCPIKPGGPVDRIEPAATSPAAPRSGSTAWAWLSPRSSACSPGTPAETRGPGQTANEMERLHQRHKPPGRLVDAFLSDGAHLGHLQGHPAHLHALQGPGPGLEHGQNRRPLLDLSRGEAGGLGLSLSFPGEKKETVHRIEWVFWAAKEQLGN